MKNIRICLVRTFLLLSLLFFAFQKADAQWRFDIKLVISGSCQSGINVESFYTSYINQYMEQVFPTLTTRQDCEMVRASVLGISAEYGGCRIHYVCGPCVGRDIGGSSNPSSILNNYSLGAVDAGTSTFATNPNEEIELWAKEFEAKMKALGGENCLPSGVGYMSDKDISIEVQEYQKQQDVNSWLAKAQTPIEKFHLAIWNSPEEIDLYIQSLFNEYSKLNISDLLKRLKDKDAISLTEKERTLLVQYSEFKDKFLEAVANLGNEKLNAMDMEEAHHVALADAVYHPDEINPCDNVWKLSGSDFDKLKGHWPEGFDSPEQIKALTELIEGVNMLNNQRTGFEAGIYYDEDLKEFSIVFRGSDTGEHNGADDFILDWFRTNIPQAAGKPTAQYGSAAALDRVLNNLNGSLEGTDIKLNIVGHSLGGGLASLLGAITGIRTYTYNAAGVHPNTLSHLGNLSGENKSFDNITAYHSQNDFLSKIQDDLIYRKELVEEIKEIESKLIIAANAVAISPTVFGPPIGTYATLKLSPVVEQHSDLIKKVIPAIPDLIKEFPDIATDLPKAIEEMPTALGNRVNLGEAGSHSIVEMKSYFADPMRTYRSKQWTEISNNLNIVSQARDESTYIYL